jgi:hypothetical protein
MPIGRGPMAEDEAVLPPVQSDQRRFSSEAGANADGGKNFVFRA